jgi:hypothetical protein
MKKRNLVVADAEKAIELMKNFLASQLIETDLERDDDTGSVSAPYFVKLVWLSRDYESDEWLGCPCWVADFHGKTHEGKKVRGIVYVKSLPTQTTEITKMQIVNKRLDYGFNFIEDGEFFRMHDKKGRYVDESFVFKNAQILREE